MWSWGAGVWVPGPLNGSEAGTLLRSPGPRAGEEPSTVNTAGGPGEQKAWETRASVLCSDMKCCVLSRQDNEKLGTFFGKWNRVPASDG